MFISQTDRFTKPLRQDLTTHFAFGGWLFTNERFLVEGISLLASQNFVTKELYLESYQRQFASIGPIEDAFVLVKFQVNWLRQILHDDLNVISLGWIFGCSQPGTEDPAL